jgi:hypothetical protein
MELYCMLTNDPSSGLVTRAVLSDPEYGEVARHALETVQFEDEVAPFGWMVKRRLAAISLSEVSEGNHERASPSAFDASSWPAPTNIPRAASQVVPCFTMFWSSLWSVSTAC